MSAPDVPPSEPGEAALLLMNKRERFQWVKIGSTTVILSAYDSLTLGPGSDLDAGWRGTSADDRIALFAEDLVLAETLQANGGIISVHSLSGPDGGVATVDVSGGAGYSPPAAPGGDPENGGKGDRGGTLGLYLETVDPATPSPVILAGGGQGGDGQTGDTTKDGGNGGPGGDGGDVTVLLSHPCLRWIDALRAAYPLEDLDAKTAATKDLLAELPPSMAPASSILAGALEGTPTVDSLNEALDNAALTLQEVADDWKARFLSTLDVSGGSYGTYGAGKTNGKNGDPGAPGTSSVTCVGDIAAAKPDWPPFFSVHPSQCAMTLEKAKLAFLFTDPLQDPDGVRDAAVLFERVRARTAPFVGLDPKSPLAQRLAQDEVAFGSVNTLATLQSLHAEAEAYLAYMKNGLDFFGYASDYVPLMSLSAITKDGVKPLLKALAALQSSYNHRFDELEAGEVERKTVETARDHALAQIAQSNVDMPQLLQAMVSDATVIDGYQEVLPPKKQAVEDGLAKYKDAIEKKGFGFQWSELIGALGQIAFAPESPLMYVTQTASIIYTGATTVDDIQGQPVRKEFIVHQIKTVEANVDALLEGVRTLDDGTVAEDDPGGAKLLADAESIEAMLDRFYGQFPDETQDLVAAIQDYVATVTARNTQVLAYNAALTLLYREAQKQQAALAQAEALKPEALKLLAADAPALTAFVSQAYYRARSDVLLFMDLASRAYRFWALEDKDLLRDRLAGHAPPDINMDVLEDIQSKFWGTYTQTIGNRGSSQVFPPDPKARRGRTFVVKGPALDIFKRTRQLMVSIPPARKSTSTGPFVNMANVRLSAVRCYVKGAKTKSGDLNMTIRHTGQEQIVNSVDKLYRFRHPPVSKPFVYTIATEEVQLDATFEALGPDEERSLALLSPCTTWHISIDADQNPGLDLSGVTEVELDFRGYCGGFS